MLAPGVTRTWTHIPAFTSWGRRRVIYVFPRRWPKQSTGIFALADVADKIRDIAKITRSELRTHPHDFDGCVPEAMVSAHLLSP